MSRKSDGSAAAAVTRNANDIPAPIGVAANRTIIGRRAARQDSRRQDGAASAESYRETNVRRRDRNRDGEPPVRREGVPYREEYRGSGQPYYEEPRRERAAPIPSRGRAFSPTL